LLILYYSLRDRLRIYITKEQLSDYLWPVLMPYYCFYKIDWLLLLTRRLNSQTRHAGHDPASSVFLDSCFRRNDNRNILNCRSNKLEMYILGSGQQPTVKIGNLLLAASHYCESGMNLEDHFQAGNVLY